MVVSPKVYSRCGLAVFIALAVFGFVLQAQNVASTALIAHDQDNLLRLHVLANSDTPFDQDLKLAVRDALIPMLVSTSSTGQSASEVEQAILAERQLLEDIARAVIQAAGADYAVQIEFAEHYFARTAGQQTLPAGEYRAIRVLIGAAAGRNWWCMLFPPMCMTQETVTAQTTISAQTNTSQLPVQLQTRYLPVSYLNRATSFLHDTWNRFFASR